VSSSPTPSRTALIAGFVTIYLVWGSTYLGIRIAVETLPPFLMASARFVVAGALMGVFLLFRGGFKAKPHQWRDNILIGGLLCLGGNGLVCWSEQKVPSGIATLMVSVAPLYITLLDWAALAFFKDGRRGSRPNSLTFAGLAVGFVGLVLLVGPSVLNEGVGHLEGARVLGLASASLFWGIGMIYTKYARDPAEPFTGSAIQMLGGGVWLLAVSVLTGELPGFHPADVSARSLIAWVYLIVMGSLVGFTTFVWLMKHSSPTRVSTYAYVNPVVAVFLGWLVLHETVSPRIFVAAAIIIAGVVLITVAKGRKPAVKSAPMAAGVAPEPLKRAG
jgi:drug/metabolite transporter (DMT)-like permease